MRTKEERRTAKRRRVRGKVSGTAERPRCAVFKSNTALHAQLIDDTAGTTLLGVSTLTMPSGTKSEQAQALGAEMAKQGLAKGISTIVFDRGGFAYTGRIKAFADAVRAGGLVF